MEIPGAIEEFSRLLSEIRNRADEMIVTSKSRPMSLDKEHVESLISTANKIVELLRKQERNMRPEKFKSLHDRCLEIIVQFKSDLIDCGETFVLSIVENISEVLKEIVEELFPSGSVMINRENVTIYGNGNTVCKQTVLNEKPLPACNLPVLGDDFVGREEEMTRMKEIFQVEHSKHSAVVVICGGAGFGKSRTALQYARDNAEQYPGGTVRIIVESLDTIYASCEELAGMLEVAVGGRSEDITKQVLQKVTSSQKLLLVLDNADDQEVFMAFMSQLTIARHHVIITSRRDNQWAPAYNVLKLKVFDARASNMFIRKNIPSEQCSEEQCETLYVLLQGLPLALIQAVSYVNCNNMSLEGLLQVLPEVRRKMFDADLPLDIHNAGVCMMVQLATEKMPEVMMTTIRRCSLLYGDCIPKSLLEDLSPADKKAEVVEGIRRSGLLVVCGVDSATHFVMHRLIQEVVRQQMGADVELHLAAVMTHIVASVTIFSGVKTNDDDSVLHLQGNLFLHTLELVRFAEIHGMVAADDNHAHLLLIVGAFLEILGRYDEAALKVAKSVAIFRHNDNKTMLLCVLLKLANLRHSQELFSEALQAQQDALLIRVRQIDKEHLVDLSAAATSTFEEVLGLYDTVAADNGEFDYTLAKILQSRANVRRSQSQYPEALELYNKVLVINQKVYGADHLNVAATLNSMGTALRLIGNYSEALKLLEKALSIKESKLGSEDLTLTTTLNNIAVTLRDLGKNQEALQFYERSLDIMKQVYGGYRHPRVVSVQKDISMIRFVQGLDWESAPIQKGCLSQRAYIQSIIGHYSDAVELYQAALDSFINIYGWEHYTVADTLNNLGIAHGSLGSYNKAMLYFMRSMVIKRKIYGAAGHSTVGETVKNIADLFSDQGMPDADDADALKLYETSLGIFVAFYGTREHSFIADTLNNMAIVFEARGEITEALQLYEESLALKERVLGRNHPKVAITLKKLGDVHYGLNNYDEAMKRFQESLAINISIYGNQAPPNRMADTYNGMGCVRYMQKKYVEAMSLYEKALEVYLGSDDHDPLRIANVLKNMGLVRYCQEFYDEALELFKRALAVADKACGRDHPVPSELQGYIHHVLRKREPVDDFVKLWFFVFLFCGSAKW